MARGLPRLFGVVGAGQMGAGIAQVAATCGLQVGHQTPAESLPHFPALAASDLLPPPLASTLTCRHYCQMPVNDRTMLFRPISRWFWLTRRQRSWTVRQRACVPACASSLPRGACPAAQSRRR